MKLKRILSLFLVTVMIMSAVPFVSLYAAGDIPVWDGSISSGFASGDGSKESPYLITDGSELAYLASRVNEGYSYYGSYFELDSDIVLNDTSDLGNWGTVPPANLWTMIGNDNYLDNDAFPDDDLSISCFAGYFNGNGHTVSGVYVCDKSDEFYNIGLFGCVLGGAIENLGVTDSYIYCEGGAYIGGIVGYYIESGSVTNCFSTATVVSGEGGAGGIVGYAENVRIEKCRNSGGIIANYSVGCYYGGIAGYSEGVISQCSNTGSVSVTSDDWVYDVGGIAGYVENAVDNCFNSGNISVTATNEIYCVGGVVGCSYASKEVAVDTCYNVGDITVLSDTLSDIGGTVGYSDNTVLNCYYTEDCIAPEVNNEIGIRLTGEQAKTQAVYEGFDFVFIWEMDTTAEYGYPVFQSHIWENGVCSDCGKVCPHYWISGMCIYCGVTCQNHIWNSTWGHCDICALSCLHEEVKDGLCVVCKFDITTVIPWDGTVAASFAGGDGTEQNPYKIANGSQLAYFSELVRNSGTGFSAYVELTNDIDLNNLPFASIGYSSEFDYSSGWFAGRFNGNNRKIIGFNNSEQGLFGRLGGADYYGDRNMGVIENTHVYGTITVDSPNFDIGGIVGRTERGTVQNCSFSGTVTVTNAGFYYYGGILGEGEEGFVTGCFSNTDIRVNGSPRGVGGIVGGAEYNAPLIDKCINNGNVSADSYNPIGGVAGRGNVIINSVNNGTVTSLSGESVTVGGVAGTAQSVFNCYNTGKIVITDTVLYLSASGIANQVYEIRNCYNAGAFEFTLSPDYYESDVYVAGITGATLYDGNFGNLFSTVSEYPVYYAENSETYETEAVYDGVITSEYLASSEFVSVLSAWATENLSYVTNNSFGDEVVVSYEAWKKDRTHPKLEFEAPTVIIEANSDANDGTSVGNIIVSGGKNEFKAGETVTVTTDYSNTDYRFIGWYANGDYTKVISNNKAYSFTVSDELALEDKYVLTALYVKVYSSVITVNGGGSNFYVEGNEYSSQYVKEHTPGKIVTVMAKDRDNFAYWTNTIGRIVSYEPRYTFIVAYDLTLTAVYNTKLEDKYTVLFVSDYGQVMRREQLTLAEISSLTAPKVPAKAGYGVGKWALDNSQIIAEAQKGSDVIIVRPEYPEIVKKAAVTVMGGSILPANESGEYVVNTKVTVKADTPEEGTVFAYWQDEKGTVLGYNESYTFIVSKDITLTAVYVNVENSVEKLGTAEITSIVRYDGSDVNAISFTASFSVPNGCTIDFAGVVATSDAAKAQNLTADNADFVRGNPQTQLSGRFTWTKGCADLDTVWYVRAYLIYTDSNGVSHTVYSSVASASYNGLQ